MLSETIDDTDSTFAREAAPVPEGALVPGRTYALVIKTTTLTRTARAGLLGDLNTRYDNVGLTVDDSPLPPGVAPIGDGALGSPGVTVHNTSVTDRTLTALLGSINVFAEVGRGPGGSVVPMARCTIIGTPKNDRIVGTKGNDVICGLAGNDTIDGAGGNDIVDTANGNDRAKGGTGKDGLIGVRGKDRLVGPQRQRPRRRRGLGRPPGWRPQQRQDARRIGQRPAGGRQRQRPPAWRPQQRQGERRIGQRPAGGRRRERSPERLQGR